MSPAPVIEGFAIVSEDGMLADAAGVMPPGLMVEADQRFFERGLNAADLVVHGRHSREQHKRSAERRRLILTRHGAGLEQENSAPEVFVWNPALLPFEEALHAFSEPVTRIGVIGGTDVFGLFLDRYDVFYLTRGPALTLPGGRPVFPEVPALTPEEVLTRHGMVAREREVLDAGEGVAVVAWRRAKERAAMS